MAYVGSVGEDVAEVSITRRALDFHPPTQLLFVRDAAVVCAPEGGPVIKLVPEVTHVSTVLTKLLTHLMSYRLTSPSPNPH